MEDLKKQMLSKERYDINDLVQIVKILRSPDGCPWDKVQTHASIRKDFLEEVYEVMEAIDCDDPAMLREELGDVLLQVVFHCDIEADKGNFTLDDAADEVCKKLIIRHPHVFGDVTADTVDKVLTNWDSIKKDEKKQESFTDTMKSVPKVFPALMRAQKLGKRASRASIDFETQGEVISLIRSKLDELQSGKSSPEEIGDLLFLCTALARISDVDSEELLGYECDSFIDRFEKLENSGKLSDTSAKELYYEKADNTED